MLAFLNDAVTRSVVRSKGPSWEFRHDTIQERLSTAALGPDGGETRPGRTPAAVADWYTIE